MRESRGKYKNHLTGEEFDIIKQKPENPEVKAYTNVELINKETGEVLELSHRWVYLPEGATLEEAVFEGEPEVALAEEKQQPILLRQS